MLENKLQHMLQPVESYVRDQRTDHAALLYTTSGGMEDFGLYITCGKPLFY
jgi:hypothetical protein